MIAEHDRHAVPERAHVAEHCERAGAAVDEIAGEPEPVARRIEFDPLEQTHEFRVAALQVADRVEGHGGLVDLAGNRERERRDRRVELHAVVR